MTDDYYKQTFDSALADLKRLSRERATLKEQLDALDERIEKVRQAAVGLTALAGVDFQEIKERHPDLFEEQLDQRIGLTDAIRSVLSASPIMLTPMEIRDRVFQVSPAVAGHKNPLASIHAVLRRLQDKNEVIYGVDVLDRTTYGWIGSDDWKERIGRWLVNSEEVIERVSKLRGVKRGD